ncbi:MAG: glycine--tRNA ligase [Candidatus Woesearchaeota archaeon]
MSLNVEEMASFCKRKGIIYPSSEIYGGLSGFFNYGPYGSEIKKNVIENWWKYWVRNREDIVGIDGSIIANPKVWKASGHVDGFSDLILETEDGQEQLRADHFLEDKLGGLFDGVTPEEVDELVKKNNLTYNGKKLKSCVSFNMMFTTNIGPKSGNVAYLRPETAQIIFTDFKLIQENARLKLPFGIAQVGKAFRNEISPRNFIFRSREFEQMEIEYFIHPEKRSCPFIKEVEDVKLNVLSSAMQGKGEKSKIYTVKEVIEKNIIQEWHAYFLAKNLNWFVSLGCNPENFRVRQHLENELAHYSSDCWDLEYNYPFGWKELQGVADRSDYDLTKHIDHSKKDLSLYDEEDKKKIVPHVIAEPSLGVDRAILVLMYEAYNDDKQRGNIVLHLNPKIAPIQVAVLPLTKKLDEQARKVFEDLREDFTCFYDNSASIGRRYARMDEIGTPFCVTFDFDSLEDESVTIRHRDSTDQERVKIKDLKMHILKNI